METYFEVFIYIYLDSQTHIAELQKVTESSVKITANVFLVTQLLKCSCPKSQLLSFVSTRQMLFLPYLHGSFFQSFISAWNLILFDFKMVDSLYVDFLKLKKIFVIQTILKTTEPNISLTQCQYNLDLLVALTILWFPTCLSFKNQSLY